MNGPDVAAGGGPPASGTAALVNAGAPAHVGSPGPNAVKVTVPVGTGAAAGLASTVAVSEIGWPSVAPVAWVVMVAVAAMTCEVSFGAPQGLVAVG